jgi:hypothetical protein
MEVSFNVYNMVANEAEIARTSPIDWSSFPKGKLLDEKYAQLLEKEGILKLTYLQNGRFYGQVLDLRYEPVQHPDVQLVERKAGYQNANTVVFTVARPSVEEVKGVAQEGNNARVEAVVFMAPTEMYNRLVKCANELLEREGLVSSQCGGNCAAGKVLIKSGEIGEIEKKYYLSKYDDGWRVVR